MNKTEKKYYQGGYYLTKLKPKTYGNEIGSSSVNSKQVLDYMNNEENGCEPVPWFIVKTKLVTNE